MEGWCAHTLVVGGILRCIAHALSHKTVYHALLPCWCCIAMSFTCQPLQHFLITGCSHAFATLSWFYLLLSIVFLILSSPNNGPSYEFSIIFRGGLVCADVCCMTFLSAMLRWLWRVCSENFCSFPAALCLDLFLEEGPAWRIPSFSLSDSSSSAFDLFNTFLFVGEDVVVDLPVGLLTCHAGYFMAGVLLPFILSPMKFTFSICWRCAAQTAQHAWLSLMTLGSGVAFSGTHSTRDLPVEEFGGDVRPYLPVVILLPTTLTVLPFDTYSWHLLLTIWRWTRLLSSASLSPHHLIADTYTRQRGKAVILVVAEEKPGYLRVASLNVVVVAKKDSMQRAAYGLLPACLALLGSGRPSPAHVLLFL